MSADEAVPQSPSQHLPPSRNNRSRTLIIALVAVVVVLGAALIVALSHTGSGDEPSSTNTSTKPHRATSTKPHRATPSAPSDPLLSASPPTTWQALVDLTCGSGGSLSPLNYPGTVRSGTCTTGTAGAFLWLWSDPAVADTAISTMSCSRFQGAAIISGPIWLVVTSDVEVAGKLRQRGGSLLTCR